MIYTIKQLFKVIDEIKAEDEFFYELSSGGFGVDYYMNGFDIFTEMRFRGS